MKDPCVAPFYSAKVHLEKPSETGAWEVWMGQTFAIRILNLGGKALREETEFYWGKPAFY